jgi:hypothetical protein
MIRLLRLKHWQLFALLIGISILCQIVIVSAIITGKDALATAVYFPAVTLLVMVLYFGWFYAMGTHLHRLLPPTVRMSLTKFRIFMAVPIVYIAALSIFLAAVLRKVQTGTPLSPMLVLALVPLHLFSMFCIFYCLYFNAKALKSVEWGGPVSFNDFAGEFFLIWFFPIGVWFIQPRLNRLFGEPIGSAEHGA